MTRETKIGLLVGLGFIVVFAILLSYAGSPPPTGDRPAAQVVDRERTGYPVLDGAPPPTGGAGSEAMGPASLAADTSVADARLPDAPIMAEIEEVSEPLPRPVGVGPQPVDAVVTVVSEEVSEPPAGGGVASRLMNFQRVAPSPAEPIADPRPTPRPDPPVKTTEPESSPGSSPLKSAPPKEYLVKKGDTMSGIAATHYGTSKPAVLNYLVKSNEGRIKDVNSVIEGQKLLIPDLPPEMFESVPSFDATLVRTDARTVSMEDLADGAVRRAPKPSLDPRTTDKPHGGASELASTGNRESEADPKPANPGGGEQIRWYEVKPKDTLSSIAKEQLGSAQRWQEIKKLNRDLDPTKVRPGDRIKLPPRSQSRTTTSNRVSV